MTFPNSDTLERTGHESNIKTAQKTKLKSITYYCKTIEFFCAHYDFA